MQRRNQSFKRNIGQPGMRGHGVAPTVLVLALGFHGTAAWADCQTAGSAVTCDASSPNPYTGTVGSGASSGGLTITVGPDARIESGNAHAISVGTGNSISLDGNAQVSNSATTGGPGNYSTIEFEHSNTLTIGADARVAAEGTDPTAHAIALTGRSNTITNYGTVSSASGAAIWNQFEGIYVNNTVYNYGVIETAANGGDAVVIGSVTGNNATDAGISLHNFAGARIVGNVVLSDTDDSVRLEAGSTLTGSLDGGTGTDTLYLAGTTGSSELSRDVSNFNEISKIDSGSTWTLSGSLGANSSGKVTVVNAYNGELIVTGDNRAAAAGSAMTVWAGARLQVNTTSAMAAIESNGSGVAAFSQQTDGTYAGVLSGGGNFAKEGAGSLTLTGVNTYTGALQLKEGKLIVSAAENLGAANSRLEFDGGTLNTTSDMTSARRATIDAGGGMFEVASGTTLNWTGLMLGNGTLVKEGAGTLALSGFNSHGGTVVNAGTVQISNDYGLGNGALTLNNSRLASTADIYTEAAATVNGNGTFDTANGTTLQWMGDIGGTGALVKTGAGTLLLGGDSLYAGGTVVNAGTVQVFKGASLGGGALTLNNARLASLSSFATANSATLAGNGTFDTATGTTLGWAGDIGGAGTLVKTGQGTLVLGGTNQYGGGTTVNAGTVQVARDANLGAAAGALSLNNARLASTGTFSTARTATLTGNGTFDTADGTTLGWTGAIDGAGALVKTGQGTLVLGADNQYAAGTTVNAGTVQVARDANLGAAAGAVTLDGGTLAASASFSSARGVTVGAGNGAMSVANGASLDWQGLIGGTGALIKEGAGTLVLGNDNQYAAGTVVNAGTVQVARDANLGAAAGAVTLDGGTLAASASFSSARGVTVGAGNGAMSVANGASLDWQGLIGGTGALIKEGAGTLVLGNDNQYAAGTVVNAGTVQVARDANLGAVAGAVALNDARLASTGTFSTARAATLTGNGAFDTADGTTLGWTGDIGGAGTLVKEGLGTLVLDGANQYGGGTTVNAGTVQVARDANLGAAAGAVALNDARLASTGTFSTARAATLTGNGTFDTADGTTLDWAGDIGGAGALVKEGLGTLVLDGDNQYAGGTTVNAGTVQVARDANLGAAGGAVRLQGATLASTASFASARTLTLGAAGGTFATLGATTLGWDAAIDGAGGLTKTGAGDLVLSRANTYAGPTLIKEGRLAVNGSIASPVTIDPDGVLGGTGRILGAVANSGTVAPGNSIGTLTIVGNYAGTGGRLEMEAELGGDASPADRLVIDGGAATGSTSVAVINQGGLGGQTDQGIPLVVARNGATTTADAFSLASPVAAGAYEYKLLRGTPDGAAANAQNWYLRSGLLVPPAEVPGGGPGGAPEPEFIPFYRPEVALYAGAPMLMRAVGLQALGTYHERTGEQGLMTRDDPDPVRRGAWTRAFGRTFERSGSGDVDPRFDGHVAGLQAGVDLYARRSDKGHADLAGVFGGYANARGHMDGFARGETGAYAGKPDLNAYYIGGYWTHIGPSGWYVDAVLAGTRYEQKAKSSNDLRTEAKGWGVTASVEAGYPVPIGEKWHIEPQAQLVYQRLTVSNGEDDVSSVSYRTPDSVTARLGARLSGQYAYNTTQLRPFMEVSLLRDFAGTDTVTFSGIDRIDSRYQATAVDLKAGLVAQVRKDVGLWGQVGYGKSIGGGDGSDRGWAASLGLRIEY
ncbi:autotransporter outer membrane beta-barrel domain-containing protein [Bordetella bronchiseptica]|uniref:autotransporter outer membrane beta-barrel domain-containing protein n=1 Tax=Bordetella bronchiseptica TaxID=518 RepID=UPI0012384E64|nr:autotransporter outer membrane beta-barrel domain-containing protein [Bordetella bronchiseptica]QET69347.1 autotransporter outer membrane beta-barrel domain-containing protein [Bordetella bronchiseptica]